MLQGSKDKENLVLGALGIYPLEEGVEVLEHKDLLQALTHLMALSIDRSEAAK